MINNLHQEPLLLQNVSDSPTRCSNYVNRFCGSTQQLAKLKCRHVIQLTSVLIDITHMWLTVIFFVYWSFSKNYFKLIPFIPSIIIMLMISISLTTEINLSRARCMFITILLPIALLIAILMSFACPNTTFSMLTSAPFVEKQPQEKNPRVLAAYALRQKRYLQHISHVLQYVTTGSSFKDNIHRIVATNYYLQSVFHDTLPPTKKEKNAIYLERIRYLHKQIKPNPDSNKLIDADVYWTEIADVVTSDKQRLLLIHLGGLLYIWSFIQTVILFLWTPTSEVFQITRIAFLIYVVAQVLSCRLYWLFYTFSLYLKHILPIFNWDTKKLKALRWNQAFEAPENMMRGIHAVHEILYGVHRNEIQPIYQCVYEHDIAGLIAQYIWIELPFYSEAKQGISSYLEYKKNLGLPKEVEVLIEEENADNAVN